MQKITPNLWFNGNAEEAVNFYVAVFKDAQIISTVRYPSEGLADFQKDFAGKVLTIEFTLMGQRFIAINAGDNFKFNEAISFMIECADQDEIDYYWGELSKVKESEQCGWCKDSFGLSWQVVPDSMEQLMSKPDAFEKLMQMKKIVIADFNS